MKLKLFALILLVPSASLAGDGVREINQACAVNTGCFTSDAAGLPVFITQPGSYRLTGNLVVPDLNTDAIVIGGSSIQIDLNGFEITRAGCEGSASSCTVSGAGTGVLDAGLPNAPHIGNSVMNGTISGMGAWGVELGGHSVVSDVRARWNGFFGIEVGANSRVSDCTANENETAGIVLLGGGSIVSGNTANDNGVVGLGTSQGDGSLFERNTSRGSAFGMQLNSNDAYRGNVITGNSTGAITYLGAPAQNLGENYCQGTGVASPSCP